MNELILHFIDGKEVHLTLDDAERSQLRAAQATGDSAYRVRAAGGEYDLNLKHVTLAELRTTPEAEEAPAEEEQPEAQEPEANPTPALPAPSVSEGGNADATPPANDGAPSN